MYDVYGSSKLRFVLQKMIATRSHHLWVIDTERRVLGVVGYTDILRLLVRRTAHKH